MKYLKRYQEAVGVRLNSELKSTVEDLLIDLRDEEFETKVSEIDYHSQKERVKVVVSRGKEFTYSDIKPQIESVWSYLNSEGFKIEHFTCVEDCEKFEEPEGDFTIQQKVKGYVWGMDPSSFKVTSIEKDFQRRPEISKTEMYDPMTFDRINNWTFEISFTKDKIVVDKTRGHLSTNEELKPQTYISAADKLSKLGHIKRPEQLKAWAETIKQREVEAKHKMTLEEAKKLGQFQLRFTGRGSEVRFANCYIQLYFNSDYYLNELLLEWLDGDRDNLWPQFMFGVHPVSEEDLEVLNWFSGDIKDYTNRANGIIWLQDVYINLTTQNCVDEDGVKLPMTPSGVISIEGSEFSEVYFANRREAIKFRNLLVALFEGDIDYIQPNGKDFKEDILETWCEHDERPVELSELEDFIDKLRMTNLNRLYRD
jgi:hypothetical protein